MNEYLRLFLAVVVFALTSAQVLSQQPKGVARQEQQDSDVVRISVRLVQIDGTVTDKQGNQVTDLQKDDFGLFVDGREQKITSFSYVPAQSIPRTAAVDGDNKDRAPELPSLPLRPEQVRRTIALVVANVSVESLYRVKEALRKFVDDQMQPGDLVSIVRPSDVSGVAQQFTSDKRLLHLAIDGVRWNPLGNVGVDAVPNRAVSPTTTEGDDATSATARAEAAYDDIVGSSWLRSLNLIVRGLEGLPGRKSVILFSDRIRLFGPDQQNRRIMDAVHRITDRAIRSLIVFYTIDSRGLQTLSDGASAVTDPLPDIGIPARPGNPDAGAGARQSDSRPLGGPEFGASVQTRILNFWKDQEGLALLAEETGGSFSHSSDPTSALSRILNQQKGYYVIGYRPDEATFKLEDSGRPYHHIAVSVKKSGLRSHFRKGFYGNADKAPDTTSQTSSQRILAALTSPFDSSDVRVKLTSLFGYDKKEGPFVRSLLHVDARGLSFTDEADGRRLAVINVFAAVFDENGPIGNAVAQKYMVHVRKNGLEQVQRDGLTYELMTPVQNTGIYQLRVAVQDADSQRIGSASQFIEVPDVAGKRLVLTGLVVSGKNASDETRPEAPTSTDEDLRLTPIGADARPAVRRFGIGMQMEYAFIVLNAQIDPASRSTLLDTQTVLYRDGKSVYQGPKRRLNPGEQKDLQQIVVKGKLNLGAELSPGEYTLQVIVTDNQAKEYVTATRWIDFELLR